MPEKDLFEIVKGFFKDLENSEMTKKHLKRFDRRIQFLVTDGDPLLLTVEDGITGLERKKIPNPDLLLEADSEIYSNIFKKGGVSITRLTFAEKLWMRWADTSSSDYPWLGMLIRMGQGR
jgi:hypothetical protein